MRNAQELYDFIQDRATPMVPGPMIVAFEGFLDAGSTQDILIDHLLDSSEVEDIASFDIDQLLDYRDRRPPMVFESSRWDSYTQPQLKLMRLRDREGTAYYILAGPEPDFQWERVVVAIKELIEEVGITLVVNAHGIPMAVPHSRPVGMTSHATNDRLLGQTKPVFGQVHVPGSLAALLELRLGEAGLDAVGFAIHVPHYLAQSRFADGALAALNAVVDITGLNLPNDDLVHAAQVNRADIAKELAANPEIQEAVAGLEQQYDEYFAADAKNLLSDQAAKLPSAEELGAEFEDFLRTVEEHPEARHADNDGEHPEGS